jgi:hypothetical protein
MSMAPWRRVSRSVRRPGPVGGRAQSRARRPDLEALEGRWNPSTWTGAVDGLWATAGNWDVPPTPGDALVFPAGASRLSSTNDLGAGFAVGSLTIADDAYVLGGESITLAGPVVASYDGGFAALTMPIAVGGPVSVTVADDDASLILFGNVSGAGSLTKGGAGTLLLVGSNAITGTVQATGGTLLLNQGGVAGPAVVGAGATLGGNGAATAITATGGTVRPGIDGNAGLLTTAGALVLDGASTLSPRLEGTAPGEDYSQVRAATVTLAGAGLDLDVAFTPTGNPAFTIVDNTGADAVSGTFAGLADEATFTRSGQTFRIDYDGGDGNDVVLTRLIDTTTTLASAPGSPVFGQAVTLTATVAAAEAGAPEPTGTVTFLAGATTLGTGTLAGGVATFTTSTLPVGTTAAITARYEGGTSLVASTSAPIGVTVAQAGTTTTLAVAPGSPVYGQGVTLSATVAAASPGAGTPAGTVRFFAGTTPLGAATIAGGTATLTTSQLPVGTSSITAVYEGDPNFATSTSAAQGVVVAKAGTTTTVAAAPGSPVYGQPVTLTANVAVTSPGFGIPSGTVTFLAGATTLGTGTVANGQATFTTSGLPVGVSSITARYDGDGNFETSTSAVQAVTVAQAATTTALTATPNPSVAGFDVTLRATVAAVSPGAGTPTGTVTFFAGATSLGTATLAGGVATLATDAIPVGTNGITARFEGDTNFTTSTSAAVSQVVNKVTTTTTLVASDATPEPFGPVTLTATVRPATGSSVVPTGNVRFLAGATLLGTATLADDGTATLTLPSAPVGVLSVTAQYPGDASALASTATAVTLTVGTENERYVNQLYERLLGRPAEPAGLDAWTAQLAGGRTRAQVAGAIQGTRDARAYAVQQAYETYLGRAATDAEVSRTLRAALDNGTNIEGIVLSSREYFRTAGGGTVQGYLDALGEDLFGQSFFFDPALDAYLTGRILAGEPLVDVVRDILTSRPGKVALVSNSIRTILDRDPNPAEAETYASQMNQTLYLRGVQVQLYATDEFYQEAINAPATITAEPVVVAPQFARSARRARR